MQARFTNAVGSRLNQFHSWKVKNILVHASLKRKYILMQRERHMKRLTLRNLATQRAAKAGLIPILGVYYNYLRRKNRSLKPLIVLKSSFFDILLNDLY